MLGRREVVGSAVQEGAMQAGGCGVCSAGGCWVGESGETDESLYRVGIVEKPVCLTRL